MSRWPQAGGPGSARPVPVQEHRRDAKLPENETGCSLDHTRTAEASGELRMRDDHGVGKRFEYLQATKTNGDDVARRLPKKPTNSADDV